MGTRTAHAIDLASLNTFDTSRLPKLTKQPKINKRAYARDTHTHQKRGSHSHEISTSNRIFIETRGIEKQQHLLIWKGSFCSLLLLLFFFFFSLSLFLFLFHSFASFIHSCIRSLTHSSSLAHSLTLTNTSIATIATLLCPDDNEHTS